VNFHSDVKNAEIHILLRGAPRDLLSIVPPPAARPNVHRDPAATGQAVGPVLEDLQALQQGPGGRRAVERDRVHDVLGEHGVVDADALVAALYR